MIYLYLLWVFFIYKTHMMVYLDKEILNIQIWSILYFFVMKDVID